MSTITGYIPGKVIFISRGYEEITNSFEDGGEINKFKAMPTFIATNEKTKETGLSWARRQKYSYYLDPVTKLWVNKKLDIVEPDVVEVDNKPFTKLRIVSYQHRSEGGGAFKMIVEDKYYVDLRIDTILDILVNAKIEEGEVKGCKFIWARIGSQMKVVRLGSEIHKRLLEVAEIKATPIKKKDLKPGDVIESVKGEKRIFLGHANTIDFIYKNNGYKYGHGYEYTFQESKYLKDVMIFVNEWNFKDFLTKETIYCDFLVNIPKGVKVGEMKSPENWIEKIRGVKIDRYIDKGNLAYYSKYKFLTEQDKFPELPQRLEIFRNEYEALKAAHVK